MYQVSEELGGVTNNWDVDCSIVNPQGVPRGKSITGIQRLIKLPFEISLIEAMR